MIYSKSENIGSRFSIFLIPMAVVEAKILIKIKILAIAKRISRKLNFISILIFSVIYCCLTDILSVIRMILPEMIAIKSIFKAFLPKITEIVSILDIILLKTIGIM
jgi:hypothetical protein